MKIERVHPGVLDVAGSHFAGPPGVATRLPHHDQIHAAPDGPSPKVARGATLSIESHRVPDDGTQHDLSQRCSCGPTIRVEHHEREGQ